MIRDPVRSRIRSAVETVVSSAALSAFDQAVSDLVEAGAVVAELDPTDLTSQFEGTDGDGGNPSAADPVGVVVGKEEMTGRSFENFIAGRAGIEADAVGRSFAGPVASQSGGVWTLLRTADSSTNQYIDIDTPTQGDVCYINITVAAGGGGATTSCSIRDDNTPIGSVGVGTHTFVVSLQNVNGRVRFAIGQLDSSCLLTINSVVIVPAKLAAAPSDAGRPTLRQSAGGVYYWEPDGTDDALEFDALSLKTLIAAVRVPSGYTANERLLANDADTNTIVAATGNAWGGNAGTRYVNQVQTNSFTPDEWHILTVTLTTAASFEVFWKGAVDGSIEVAGALLLDTEPSASQRANLEAGMAAQTKITLLDMA